MPRSEVDAVGVKFEGRQDILADLYDYQDDGIKLAAELGREPDNRHDPNAVAVLVRPEGATLHDHVGYIPKALAAKWAARMDAGEEITVRAVRIVRSEKRGGVTYGARIDVELEEHTEEAAANG